MGMSPTSGSYERTQRNHLGYSLLDRAFRRYASGIQRTNLVSYQDRLDLGFIVDRELVPAVWDLADMHVDEIERLFAASDAEWAEPPQPAAPRRRQVRRISSTDPTMC